MKRIILVVTWLTIFCSYSHANDVNILVGNTPVEKHWVEANLKLNTVDERLFNWQGGSSFRELNLKLDGAERESLSSTLKMKNIQLHENGMIDDRLKH